MTQCKAGAFTLNNISISTRLQHDARTDNINGKKTNGRKTKETSSSKQNNAMNNEQHHQETNTRTTATSLRTEFDEVRRSDKGQKCG